MEEGSQSVDGSIVRWEWRDEEGRPIGDTPAIKVRLKSGHHSFTLTAETDIEEQQRQTL